MIEVNVKYFFNESLKSYVANFPEVPQIGNHVMSRDGPRIVKFIMWHENRAPIVQLSLKGE